MTDTHKQENTSCSVENNKSTDLIDSKKKLEIEAKAASKENENSEDIESSEVETEISAFEGFGFSDALLNTLKTKGYKEPSPIQKAAFPELMLGRDLVGQAQTGTGKTAAFALPLLERLKESSKSPQVLVLAPTRELAMQVADSFKAYGAGHPHLKTIAIYGGSDFRAQINTLRRGVDIVVGTPGRVMDHMRQGTLNTSELSCLVLDEADEMLRMGFIDDVEWILEQLPEDRQMILFSATMPSEIRTLSKRYLNEPAEITIKSQVKEARLIKQSYISIHNSHKIEALKRILEAIDVDGVIIFVRTKAITMMVAEALEAAGHDVAVLNGDVPQNQRERTVERLKKGSIDILVATDVAARGLDVERIGLVINYDMPFDSEAYVHRIGRTGRAGRTGEAILFVNYREKHFLKSLERAVNQSIEQIEIPNNAAINSNRIKKLEKKLLKAAQTNREASEELKVLQMIITNVSKELDISEEELAIAALDLAIGTKPLLAKGDEAWINQRQSRSSNNDRRDSRYNGRRRNEREAGRPEKNMERFRVEVGHRDRVKPGNLVGAIANETGLNGRMIGRIQIFENYSFVDLPKGMPENTFNDLKKIKVMNRELKINRSK